MRRKILDYQYSMRKLWAILSAFLVISMILVLFVFRYQQQTDLIQRTAETQFESIKQFGEQLDNGLTQTENYLYSSFYGNADIQTLNGVAGTLTKYEAKQSLAALLSRGVQLNEFVEAAWFYQPSGKAAEELFLSRNNYTGITIHEIKAMKEWISQDLQNLTESQLLSETNWITVRLEDTSYLLWGTPLNGSFCGAWVSIPYLQGMLAERTIAAPAENEDIRDSEGRSLYRFESEDAIEIPEDGDSWIQTSHRQIQIGLHSAKGDFVLQKQIPCAEILRQPGKVQPVTFLFVFFCVTVLLGVLVYQYLIYRPFQNFLTNLDTIRFRRTDSSNNRLPVRGHLRDIRSLSTAINQLLDRNEALNQKVLTTELRERDVQVQYLQIRLKAHFYMNGLSLIHAMARMGQNDLIQELSQCLIEYLRFIDVDAEKFVRLRDELDHVQSYARIQELRFPELFRYTEDVSAELYDASIPPLVLQTFVENSIEHGMRQGENYQIQIQAYYQEQEGRPGMYFRIQDNGAGFSEEALQEFAMKHYPIVANQNHGIGIKNVINRLKLLYHNEATITFDNASEGGALIELWLPLLDLEEEPDEL